MSISALNVGKLSEFGIPAWRRKFGPRNTIVTSDFRPEVELRQFRACAWKDMQCSLNSWPNHSLVCCK